MAYPTQLLRAKTDPATPDTLPTTALTGTTAVMPDGQQTHVVLQFMQATTAAPAAQLADNTTTADVTVAVQRPASSASGTPLSVMTTLTAQRLVRPLTVEVPPGFTFGVYLGALTSPNAGTQRVNVYWTPIRKTA